MSGRRRGRIQIEAPPVTRHISRTLERYPDGGQILKELIQNADDAEATEIKFRLDTVHHSQDGLIHPSMGIFQGPALLAYNNAVFKEDDWEHFGKMEDSSKEKEALKVGRFGVGFLSVFHITDLPTVISTNVAALLDPHQRYTGTNRMGWDGDLDTFLAYSGHASCFNGLFGLTPSTKYFDGTLFRFPLRTSESNSEIVNTPYPVERISEFLYESFIKEAPIIMLFLKYIEKISLYIDDRLVYQVSINPSQVSLVRQERKALIDLATRSSLSCSLRVYSMSITIDDYRSGEHDSNQYHWLLMNSIGSTDRDIIQMSQKQENIPWVGIAASLPHSINLSQLVLSSCDITNIAGCVQQLQIGLARSHISLQWCDRAQGHLKGQVFCFLPLPNTTHLPVNIHGYFAVSDNRRSIEWPAGDNESLKALWNSALLEKHIAPLYSILIACRTQLVTYIGTPLPLSSSEGDVTDPYTAWPLSSNVRYQQIWNELFQPVVKGIANVPILWTPAGNGAWITLNEGLYLPNGSTIPDIVIEILINANVKVVSLPQKIRETLNECGYKSFIQTRTIVPSLVRQAMKALPHLAFDNKAIVIQLLEYILSDIERNNFSELIGIKLIPLATAGFELSAFKQIPYNSDDYLFIGNSLDVREALEFLPGTECCFVDTDISQLFFKKLQQLAKWECLQLRMISPKFIAHVLLSKSICTWNRNFHTHESLQWTPGQNGHPTNDWITKVWTWINRNNRNNIMPSLVGLPLLPQHAINSVAITLLPLVDNGSYFVEKGQNDKELADIVRKLGATVVAYNSIVFQNFNIWSYVQKINAQTVLQYIHRYNLVNLHQLNNEDKAVLRIAIAQSQSISHKDLIKNLPIFEVGVGANPVRLVTLNSSNYVLPHQYMNSKFEPSLVYPSNILSNHEPLVVQLIQKLGFPCLNEYQLFVSSILPFALQQCRANQSWSNGDDLIVWMLKSRQDMMTVLQNESFIRTRANEAVIKMASELYDINDEQFEKLFDARREPVFPSDTYRQKGITFELITWRSLLKNIPQLVSFMRERAKMIERLPRDTAIQKSQYIMELISANRSYTTPLMNSLKDVPFLLVQQHPLPNYPTSLQWVGKNNFEAPSKLCHSHENPLLIGSVLPIVSAEYVISYEMQQYFRPCGLSDVLKQFQILVGTHIKANETDEATAMVHCIYKYLNQNYSQINPSQLPSSCVWWPNEQGQPQFMPLSKFVCHSAISLSPIVYSLTSDPNIVYYKKLFERAGVRESLTLVELVDILKRIADDHHQQKIPEHYLKMAIGIVQYLKDNEHRSSGEVYLPTTDDQLCLAKHCTYDDREWIRQRVGTGISKHKFVHGDIPPKTARYFGVEPLSKKVAPSTRLRLKYTQAGPKEKITRRISGIVNDYSGNIDVFKELIQNADDAGASEIKLLMDWRKHGTEYLFEKSMKHWQGPAIVAYNNATFTDQDFDNICELAAETKMKDPLKTGRFGVGFCSCYSLTDVPSFVSRHLMTIFDPHTKYLGERVSHNEPGMRIDLVENKDDLSVYEHQFDPFNRLFGCNIFDLDEDGFNGTIFRFPLRMSGFPGSEISNKDYNGYSISLLVEDLKKEGDNLVTFLKNIKSLQLFVLQNSATNPSEMKLVFEVKKQSEQNQLSRIEMIKKPHIHFPPACSRFSVNVIDTEQSINSTTQYLMSSSLCNFANIKPGLIPLAELAIKLANTVPDINIEGHLFCFLPLPLTSDLPFHVNGFFDVGKDRRGLKEAHNSPEYQWNESLIKNALPSALVAALANICKQMTPILKTDQKELCLKSYYSLWPGAYGTVVQVGIRRNWVSEVFSNAVKVALSNCNEDILWSNIRGGTWVNLRNAYLFTDSPPVPQKVKSEAIGLLISKGYSIVECPHHVRELLRSSLEKDNLFNYERFFKEIFLPNINRVDHSLRNHQLLFVLSKIQEEHHQSAYATSVKQYRWAHDVLRSSQCIPADVTGNLVIPGQLIDTRCEPVSSLYDPLEGRFPDTDFKEVMDALVTLGMVTRQISVHELSERGKSVSRINDETKCNDRIIAIFRYLHYIENQSVQFRYLLGNTEERNKRISALCDVPFIKPCPKPVDINLPWCNPLKLLSPSQLYSPDHCSLVFTQSPLFSLPVTDDSGIDVDKMVIYLGINRNEPNVKIVLDHLCCLIEYIDGKELDEITLRYLEDKKVFSSIYEFLNKQKRSNDAIKNIKHKLEHLRCIWQDKQLLSPQQVLIHWTDRPCLPYLCPLSDENKKFDELFEAIGVLKEATLEYLVNLLELIYKDYFEVPLTIDLLDFVNLLTERISYLPSLDNSKYDILLPDEDGILRPASKLSCDNNIKIEWIEALPVYADFIAMGGHFTHKTVPRDRALRLGAYKLIDAVMRDFEDESFLDGTPFGQSEDLVDRLNGILKKYPSDTSIFREFIQNADDAKATEIVFVLDHRKDHSKRTLLCDNSNWKELQSTPALCIFNNKPFTEDDIKGICKLGRGGKGDTADTIGRFGIGFNVAYHVTDCPSFISFANEETPQDFCVFDPLQRYCKKATKSKPGRRWKVIGEHMKQFPDQFKPFLVDKFSEMSVLADCFEDTSGGFVVFRLPLIRFDPHTHYYTTSSSTSYRNEKWLSEGKANRMFDMERLLKQFKSSSENMLLFLNHLKNISVFEIKKDGTCIHHLTSTVTANKGSTNLPQNTSLICETTVTHQVDDDITQSQWIISKRSGIEQSAELADIIMKGEGRGLAAFGGVAAELHATKPLEGYMFCFLPMNIPNNLPVHLNAHFLVDDSRKHLDSLPGLEKWNSIIAKYLLVPAYLELILEARDKVDGSPESINWFYNLFPKLSQQLVNASEASQLCIEHLLFEQIIKKDLPILIDARGLSGDDKMIEWLTPQDGLFCINNNIYHQTYIIQNAEEVQDVLVSLEMPITITPKHIFRNLCTVSNTYRQTGSLTPEKVLAWLKEIDLDEDDNESIIKENCELLLQFCLQGISSSTDVSTKNKLKDVPLLLTLADTLSKTGQLFESRFSGLLPHLHCQFIHPLLENSKAVGKILARGNSIVNLPLVHVATHITLKNINDPVKLSDSDVKFIKLLWEYFKVRNAMLSTIGNTLASEIAEKFSHKAILPTSDGLFYPPVLGKCIFNEASTQLHVRSAMIKLGYKKLDFKVLSISLAPLFMHSIVSDATSSSDILECLQLRPPKIDSSLILSADEITQFVALLSEAVSIPSNVAAYLKKMPIFQTVDDSYIRLSGASQFYVMPMLVPCDGVLKIQKATSQVVLKVPGYVEEKFYQKIISENEYMSAKEGEVSFYLRFLLPNFFLLDETELLKHLQFIKSQYQSSISPLYSPFSAQSPWNEVIEKLKAIPLITKEDGKRYIVSAFFDPEVEFHAKFQEAKLPPKKWRHTLEWLPFLRLLGLQSPVSTALWLSKAKKVGDEVSKIRRSAQPSQELVDKSDVLITSFEKLLRVQNTRLVTETIKKLDEDFIQFLTAASKIPFLYCSAPCTLIEHVQCITGFSPKEHKYFIQFHESVYFKSANLCCMVRQVLPKECHFLSGLESIFTQRLSVREPHSPKAVVDNLITLTKVLSTVKVFVPSSKSIDSISFIKKTIESHYYYLEKHIDEKLIKTLIDKECILLTTDSSTFQLIKPTQLVSQIPLGKDFKPFCYKTPLELMKFGKLLKALQIQEYMKPLQYIEILANIKQETDKGGKTLQDDERFLRVCQNAYEELISSIRSSQDQITFPSTLKIYLPSEGMHLTESTSLVYNDVPWIATRLKNQRLDYGFVKPPPPDSNGQRIPPSCLKVKLLSTIAVEKLHTDVNVRVNKCVEQELYNNKKSASNCKAVEVLEETLKSHCFSRGIGRLYWHKNQKDPRKDKTFCLRLKALIGLNIVCVNEIKTIVYFNGRNIQETMDSSRLCYLVVNNNRSDNNKLELYITHNVNHFSEEKLFEELATEINKHLGHCTGDTNHIKAMFQCNPDQISIVLDKREISPYDPQTVKAETLTDKEIGHEVLLSDVQFTKEDLVIVCNYEEGEKVLYHSLKKDNEDVCFKTVKVIKCWPRNTASLKDKCVEIQTGYTDKGDPIKETVSLLQLYKKLDISQRKLLECGQSSAFTKPLTLASLPDNIEEWLRDIFVYNGRYSCCSVSQLSLRLTAHLHYIFVVWKKTPEVFLPLADKIIEIMQEDDTTRESKKTADINSLITKLKELSIKDDTTVGEPTSPSLHEHIPLTYRSYLSPSTPVFNPSGRRQLFSSSHQTSQPQNVSSRIPLYRIRPPTQPAATTGYNRSGGIRNLFGNEAAMQQAEPPKPKTSLADAKVWLQQATVDYLAAVELFEDKDEEEERGLEEEAHTNEVIEEVINEEEKEEQEDKEEEEEEDKEEEEEEDKDKVEEDDDDDDDEEEEEVRVKPKKRTDRCRFPALVCFLSHEVIEKCLKGLMYAKCGLPNHLIDNDRLLIVYEEMEKSPHVAKQLKDVAKECVLQVTDHSNKSRYPNYHVPPCPPAAIYTYAEACEALSAATRMMEELNKDNELVNFVGELPEEAFRPSVLRAEEEGFPEYWDEHNEDDGDVKLVLLPPVWAEGEYYAIAMKFLKTLHCQIIRIERIQNKLLWQRYKDCARRTMQYSGTLGEQLLFHGTRFNDPKLIYEGDSSFDMRYSQNGMWGSGNYFAVNASYSNSYSYNCTGYRQMLVASVLTGLSYYTRPDNSLRKPPYRPNRIGGIQYRYDSVSGDTGGSKVYITYDNDKAYPAYLITYKQ